VFQGAVAIGFRRLAGIERAGADLAAARDCVGL
jgi:hypothetical protein